MPVVGQFYAEIEGEEFNTRMIDSSNVLWVAWPKNGQPLMLVKFRGGGIYGYFGVSRQRVVAAARAPSTGEYINRKIKPHFDCAQIRAIKSPA